MHARLILIIGVTLTVSVSRAEVTEYTDAQQWQQATEGRHTTIHFTGFADGTPINNQYENLGITFTPPAYIFASAFFVNDGWGLHGPTGVRFNFDSPQNWVAIDYPGVAQFNLLSQGQLIYTSSFFFYGGVGNFAGLVSDVSFDAVYIFKPPPYGPDVFIDDLQWGAPVPTPGAFALLAIGMVSLSRRRRV